MILSIAKVLGEARRTTVRFPLTVASALAVTIAMLALIDGPSGSWMWRLALTGWLGLTLFTAVTTAAERHRIARGTRIGWSIALLGLLGLLFYASFGWTGQFLVLRFVQLGLVGHLVVAVAAYLGADSRGFWQFNRFLFIQFLLATFYSLVLWLGLAIALAAIDKLLGVAVPGRLYAQLAALLAFLFHPWFFLSGIPDDYEALDQLDEYPLGLKVFTQFVLLPLVAVYLVILTLYLGRILLSREWPSGWIGYLVSSVATVGVLALLLVHPIRGRPDNRWINAYGRWFFAALLPSLAMLLLAIGKRIGQYGVTERRYFLLVLALWMLGVALWYAVTGSRGIRLIPVTLGTIAALTWFGPWGAYQVSYRSQVGRMAAILAANDLGAPRAVRRSSRAVSPADRRQLSAIFDYLDETRGERAVRAVLGVADSTSPAWLGDSTMRFARPAARAMHFVGLGYLARGEVDREGRLTGQSFSVQLPVDTLRSSLDLAGFEQLHYLLPGGSIRAVLDQDTLRIRSVYSAPRLTVLVPGDSVEVDYSPEIRAAVGDGSNPNGVTYGPILVDRRVGTARLRVIIEEVSGMVFPDSVTVYGGRMTVLLGRVR